MHLTNLIHQKSYERVIKKVRRSAITLLPAILGLAVLLILPLGLNWLLGALFPALVQLPVFYATGVLFVSLYYLCCILFFYTYFVDFYLDLLVITNDRLIRVNQHGMFTRTIFEVDLYQIQDALSEINGAWPSLFGYGNITIEVAAAQPKVIAEHIQNPHALRRVILDLAADDRRYHEKP